MSQPNEYYVIQDFDNKRANAHASLFVASMFGLFSLLALMGRLVDRTLSSVVNYAVIIPLLLSYVFIWLFGLYSLLNFFLYATRAHHAEQRIVGTKEHGLVEDNGRNWTWIPRKFAKFKGLTWFIHNKETVFVCIYFAIGLLPLLAFFVWFSFG